MLTTVPPAGTILTRRLKTSRSAGCLPNPPPKLPTVAWINEPTPEALIKSA